MDSSQNPRTLLRRCVTYICDGPPLLPAAGVQGAVGVCPGGTPPEFGGVEVAPGVGVVGAAAGEFVVGVVGFVPEFGGVGVFGGMVPGVWTHPFMGGTAG